MATVGELEDAWEFAAGAFRLTFHWDGERWSHAVKARGATLASSVEWRPGPDDDTGRVVSPAYQQIGVQSGDDGVRALLVGQWGKHHGSAVFHLADTSGGGGAVLAVDVAVRSAAPLSALAATYQVHLGSGQLADAGPEGILWRPFSDRADTLSLAPEAGSLIALAEAGRRETRAQAVANLGHGTATHRLRYRWAWAERPPTLDPTAPREGVPSLSPNRPNREPR